MKRGFERTQRVADLIQKSLAQMLLQDLDERFHLVTVTGVQVTRDLAYAKVYVSVLLEEEKQIKEIIKALNREAKSFRYDLAHTVDLRTVPELKFLYDESTARGFRISTLIDSALKKDKN
jgi:ribosome-binding factor A